MAEAEETIKPICGAEEEITLGAGWVDVITPHQGTHRFEHRML